MNIGPQFEYIIFKRLSVLKTLFHSARTPQYSTSSTKQQRVIQVTAAERTSLGEWELNRMLHLRNCMQYPQTHTKFQAL